MHPVMYRRDDELANPGEGQARERQLAARALQLAARQRVDQALEERGAGHRARVYDAGRAGQFTAQHFPRPVASGMLRARMAPNEPNAARPELTAVVPAYNEVESLPTLLGELRAALDATDRR